MVAKRAQGSTKRGPRSNRRIKLAESVLSAPSAVVSARGLNFERYFRQIRSNPVIIALFTGASTYFFSRFLIRYYKAHPEISNFLKENFDSVEGKLREYKNSINLEGTEARH